MITFFFFSAQLANVVIPDIASTDAARTNNDPFPHGLPNNAPVILVIGKMFS